MLKKIKISQEVALHIWDCGAHIQDAAVQVSGKMIPDHWKDLDENGSFDQHHSSHQAEVGLAIQPSWFKI